MKRKKLTRKRKAAFNEKLGPDWKRKLKRQKLAKALENIDIQGQTRGMRDGR